MGKLIKGIVLGALVGAAVNAGRQLQQGDVNSAGGVELDAALAKSAAEGALVGGVVGLFLHRRDKKRRARLLAARPRIEHALAGAGALAGVARDRALHAAEVARPHVEAAAGVARERALHAAEVARPHVEAATDAAKRRLADAA